MPRLSSRLVQIIQRDSEKLRNFPLQRPKAKRSLHDPEQSLFQRPPFNFKEYDRSILLSDSISNPITDSGAYEYHKSLPPVVRLPKNFQSPKGEKDKPREMTTQERQWWSNPYLRMLSSPLRRCCVTDQYLPSDLLLRFSFLRLKASEGSQPSLAIVPDGLEHSKYTTRKGGHSVYSLCIRESVDQMLMAKPYRRTTRDSHVTPNPKLPDQVAHLLRLRILQELERLVGQVQCWGHSSSDDPSPATIIRRLTQKELEVVEASGTVPFDDAVAVLVMPPMEAAPVAKTDLRAAMSAMPPEEMPGDAPSSTISQPISTLMPIASDANWTTDPKSHGTGLLPTYSTPVYDISTAFPSSVHRAALHWFLSRLLALERKQTRPHALEKTTELSNDAVDDTELSNAYLLCANQTNLKGGDVASVAIALWRLRMFEDGAGLEGDYSWSSGTDNDINRIL